MYFRFRQVKHNNYLVFFVMKGERDNQEDGAGEGEGDVKMGRRR
jgi:hypothetical protein